MFANEQNIKEKHLNTEDCGFWL